MDSEHRKAYLRDYWKRNIERRREIARKSRSRPEYKAWLKVYMSEWTKTNKDKIVANRVKWSERHRTRQITKDAIKSGKLIRQPCEVCREVKVEAHHLDYTDPLKIAWLCKEHHVLERRK